MTTSVSPYDPRSPARRRQTWIDLSIALETLSLDNEPSELRFPPAAHGAWCLGAATGARAFAHPEEERPVDQPLEALEVRSSLPGPARTGFPRWPPSRPQRTSIRFRVAGTPSRRSPSDSTGARDPNPVRRAVQKFGYPARPIGGGYPIPSRLLPDRRPISQPRKPRDEIDRASIQEARAPRREAHRGRTAVKRRTNAVRGAATNDTASEKLRLPGPTVTQCDHPRPAEDLPEAALGLEAGAELASP